MGWQPGSERGTGSEPAPTRPGASREELIARLRAAQGRESLAAAEKLGLLRDLIRGDDDPPDRDSAWSRSLTHEVALALAMPPQSAQRLMETACDLEVRLPGVGGLLASGDLTFPKARAVSDALAALNEADAARAEALIIDELPGKTHSQAEKLAVLAAVTIDPDSAVRRREEAERNRARVALRRDPSGAASLSGYDLPTDEALAAHASVCARATEYKESGVFPGVRMDQFRAMAYLDLINAVTAQQRIAAGQPPAGLGAPCEYGPGPDGPDSAGSGPDAPGPGPDDPAGGSPAPGLPPPPAPPAAPPKPADLIIPLATLLGLAERPGEGHALGPLDPGLCRSLAALAAASPHTTACVTVTSPGGFAIGHGCARPDRRAAGYPGHPSHRSRGNPTGHSPPHGPLTSLRARLPDGRSLAVHLGPVPTEHCDHRHQSHAYQPNDTLRHLVQVRDYECTFPTCSRHARESDFEHAVPYDQGGPTCACNAGARSRACHQVKQAKGWHVTQPRPGWHQWQTPSGRTYTQAPKRYPS